VPPADPAAVDRPLVLVVDYPGRRGAASIADLRPETVGLEACYPLAERFPREISAAAYAARLIEALPPGRRPVAVLGYCMAAPIAHEAAALVSRGDHAVPLILFDARPATAAAVADQFRVAAGQLLDQFGGPVDRAESAVTVDAGVVLRDPARAVESMRAALIRLGTAASQDDDADDMVADLVEFYLDWLVHLTAATRCSWPAWGGAVLHVMSAAHPFTDDWPAAASTERIRVDVPRVDLLRADEVRAGVCAWLARRTAINPIPTVEEKR
jgi:thioesterase domain-containing protein